MVGHQNQITASTKASLVALFKKFQFNELQESVYPEFPELRWKQTKSKLIKQHESFTTANALKIFLKDLQEEKIVEDDLRDRLLTLETIELSLHHHKKSTWYGHQFKGTCRRVMTDPEEIEEKIQSAFDQNHLEWAVRTLRTDNYIFVVMKNIPKKRKKKQESSSYFILVLEEKYFFTKLRHVSKELLSILADVMGYKDSKSLKLWGRHVDSLVQLLHSKGKLEGSAPRLKTNIPVERFYGFNFAQYNARQEYANGFFSSKSPQFETLKLGTSARNWVHDVPSEAGDEEVSLGWEFQSSNVTNFLNNLIKKKVFEAPVPEYIAHLLKFGQTELYLRDSQE